MPWSEGSSPLWCRPNHLSAVSRPPGTGPNEHTNRRNPLSGGVLSNTLCSSGNTLHQLSRTRPCVNPPNEDQSRTFYDGVTRTGNKSLWTFDLGVLRPSGSNWDRPNWYNLLVLSDAAHPTVSPYVWYRIARATRAELLNEKLKEEETERK